VKTCSHCRESLPVTSFSRIKGSTRRQSWCARCINEYSREWYMHHGDEHNARRRAAYQPKQRKLAQGRNPEVRFISRKAGKARKAGATLVDLTVQQWASLKELYDFECAYCGASVAVLTMDHIQALARGGQHTVTNVVPACLPCNQRKHDGPPPEGFVPKGTSIPAGIPAGATERLGT